MQHQEVDLFAAWHDGPHATVITTNGEVDKMGYAVMGAGVAQKAATIWPEARRQLGKLLDVNGNHCYVLPITRQKGAAVVTFPTKYHWKNPSRVELIRQSCIELVRLTIVYGWQRVFLPRPGCGNGGLRWQDVEPILDEYLYGEEFVVCHFDLPGEKIKPKATVKKGAVSKAAQKRMASK